MGIWQRLGFRNCAADHAGAWLSWDEKYGVFRCGAYVVADFASGAEIWINPWLSHLSNDGTWNWTAFYTDRAKRPLPCETKAVQNKSEWWRFICGIVSSASNEITRLFHFFPAATENRAEQIAAA